MDRRRRHNGNFRQKFHKCNENLHWRCVILLVLQTYGEGGPSKTFVAHFTSLLTSYGLIFNRLRLNRPKIAPA